MSNEKTPTDEEQPVEQPVEVVDVTEESAPDLPVAPGDVLDEDEEPAPVWDERAQTYVDIKIVNDNIVRMRTVLGQTKLNRLLAQAGLLDEGQARHEKQYRDDIAEQRAALGWLIELRMHMDRMAAEPGAEVPLPTKLEVATTKEVRAVNA